MQTKKQVIAQLYAIWLQPTEDMLVIERQVMTVLEFNLLSFKKAYEISPLFHIDASTIRDSFFYYLNAKISDQLAWFNYYCENFIDFDPCIRHEHDINNKIYGVVRFVEPVAFPFEHTYPVRA